MEKPDSLKHGVNWATSSGPKTKQQRIRQNARFFVKTLHQAGMGMQNGQSIQTNMFSAWRITCWRKAQDMAELLKSSALPTTSAAPTTTIAPAIETPH